MEEKENEETPGTCHNYLDEILGVKHHRVNLRYIFELLVDDAKWLGEGHGMMKREGRDVV